MEKVTTSLDSQSLPEIIAFTVGRFSWGEKKWKTQKHEILITLKPRVYACFKPF